MGFFDRIFKRKEKKDKDGVNFEENQGEVVQNSENTGDVLTEDAINQEKINEEINEEIDHIFKYVDEGFKYKINEIREDLSSKGISEDVIQNAVDNMKQKIREDEDLKFRIKWFKTKLREIESIREEKPNEYGKEFKFAKDVLRGTVENVTEKHISLDLRFIVTKLDSELESANFQKDRVLNREETLEEILFADLYGGDIDTPKFTQYLNEMKSNKAERFTDEVKYKYGIISSNELIANYLEGAKLHGCDPNVCKIFEETFKSIASSNSKNTKKLSEMKRYIDSLERRNEDYISKYAYCEEYIKRLMKQSHPGVDFKEFKKYLLNSDRAHINKEYNKLAACEGLVSSNFDTMLAEIRGNSRLINGLRGDPLEGDSLKEKEEKEYFKEKLRKQRNQRNQSESKEQTIAKSGVARSGVGVIVRKAIGDEGINRENLKGAEEAKRAINGKKHIIERQG